jgi:hypothetical protein
MNVKKTLQICENLVTKSFNETAWTVSIQSAVWANSWVANGFKIAPKMYTAQHSNIYTIMLKFIPFTAVFSQTPFLKVQ